MLGLLFYVLLIIPSSECFPPPYLMCSVEKTEPFRARGGRQSLSEACFCLWASMPAENRTRDNFAYLSRNRCSWSVFVCWLTRMKEGQ